MLVLTVKDGERVYLKMPGGDIEVVVVAGSQGKAKLGIEAPRAVEILRESLVEKERKTI